MKQVGLVGYPVSHSLSPRMQQAAFDALDIEARYTLWETQPGTLPERIASLRSAEILGANVTIPYKEDVVPLVNKCDPAAARIGAINTIVNRDGCLIGYNTDAPAFLQALIHFPAYPFDSHGKKVLILGTGGAARAAAMALLENGVEELMLLGRTEGHLNALLRHLHTCAAGQESGQAQASHPSTQTPSVLTRQLGSPLVRGAFLESTDARRFLSTTDLVVNATPVGLRETDTTSLIDVSLLPASALVMDMIFNPPRTPLLNMAEARGLHVLNGLSMLLYQGARAFELWTGRKAPIGLMREALGL